MALGALCTLSLTETDDTHCARVTVKGCPLPALCSRHTDTQTHADTRQSGRHLPVRPQSPRTRGIRLGTASPVRLAHRAPAGVYAV
jgi:hypothetical protein